MSKWDGRERRKALIAKQTIFDVVAEGPTEKRSETIMLCRCPIHPLLEDGTRDPDLCFSIDAEAETYLCSKCGAAGDIRYLMAEQWNKSVEARLEYFDIFIEIGVTNPFTEVMVLIRKRDWGKALKWLESFLHATATNPSPWLKALPKERQTELMEELTLLLTSIPRLRHIEGMFRKH